MTKQELVALCENFQNDDIEKFREIVAAFLEIDSDNEMKMARDWGIPPSAVRHWITGRAEPAPSLQSLIVKEIAKYLK